MSDTSTTTPTPSTTPTTPRWLTTKQAAAYAQCGAATLYTAVKRKRLRAAKLNGGSYRFLHSWIDAWLASSAPEIVNPEAPGATRH